MAVGEFRRGIRYGALSVKNELRQVHLYLVAAVTFLIIQQHVGGVGDYLAANMDRMHVFELYVHFMTSRFSQMYYLLGIMAFSCGALFYSHGAAYYLVRGNRRSWAIGQGVYLLVMVVGYNLFLLLTLCLSTGGHLTLSNQWSAASVWAEQLTVTSIGIDNIFYVSYDVLQMSPVAAGIVTFLLSSLVGMAAGMVVACSSMRARGVFGVAILGIAWYGDFLTQDVSYFFWAEHISPFGLSRLSRLLDRGGGLGILYAAVFFCILISIEFIILLGTAEKIDFVKLE